jgi:hypothetical protein
MPDAPEPSAPVAYDLCVRSDGFRLKHAEVAVTLSGDGISYELDGRKGLRPFGDIESIRIQALHGGKNAPWESMMELTFRRGLPLSIYSTSPWGTNDPDRDVGYVAFAEDLHRRIPQAERGRIRFLRGVSEERHKVMIGAFVLFLLVFGGAGLLILSIGLSRGASGLEVLGALAGIVMFGAWIVQSIRKAKPGAYDPDRLPRDIFPG